MTQPTTPDTGPADSQEKADAAAQAIAAALDRHERGVLLFSGGKESVVLADLAEPVKDRITLLWVNPGAPFPHMVDFVRGYGERFNLVELRSNLHERFVTRGLPSMIVPMENHESVIKARLHDGDRNRVRISDWAACCSELRNKPADDYVKENAVSLIIHGQRHQENFLAASLAPDTLAPLWNWTTDDVMAYINARRLRLPMQYPEILGDGSPTGGSMDCSFCTASVTPTRIQWVREHYPDIYQQLRPMLAAVYGAVAFELDQLRPGLAEADICPDQLAPHDHKETPK